MPLVLWLVGGVALLAWLERQHGSLLGGVSDGGAPGTISMQNLGGLGATNSGNATNQQIMSGIDKALKHDPDPTGISQAVLAFGQKIMGFISAHHAAALKAEGKALNDATPRMMQTFALIVQAAAKGELTSQAQANKLADRTVSLFYGEVQPIQRGRWPYSGQDMSADYQKVWKQRFQPATGAPGYKDYHAPDPCNAACVMGHFFAERNAYLVKYAVQDILAGRHGSIVFDQIPAYATQQGYPQVSVTY